MQNSWLQEREGFQIRRRTGTCMRELLPNSGLEPVGRLQYSKASETLLQIYQTMLSFKGVFKGGFQVKDWDSQTTQRQIEDHSLPPLLSIPTSWNGEGTHEATKQWVRPLAGWGHHCQLWLAATPQSFRVFYITYYLFFLSKDTRDCVWDCKASNWTHATYLTLNQTKDLLSIAYSNRQQFDRVSGRDHSHQIELQSWKVPPEVI